MGRFVGILSRLVLSMKLFLYLKHFPINQITFHEGTSKAVHGLASGFAQNGATVVILCEAPTPGTYISPAGYTVECFAAPHSSPSFRLSKDLRVYLKTVVQSTDLVILNGIFHSSVYAMARSLRRLGVPYIAAPHDAYHPVMFQKNAVLKWLYWFLCEKSMLQQALAIQNLDDAQSYLLRQKGVKTACMALPNGFDSADMLVVNDRHPFQLAAPRAIFFGRIDAHHKGLDLLIRGFSQSPLAAIGTLVLQGPDAGDLQSLMALAAKMPPPASIKFLPPNYDTSPIQFLQQYDIFCLTSRFEGFGLSALEAMLAGRVLLVSAEAGIARHVLASGCGVTVPPTVEGVHRGLTQLLDCRSQWDEMGLRGRDYALKHLQWGAIARQALTHYQGLLPNASLLPPLLPTVESLSGAQNDREVPRLPRSNDRLIPEEQL
jgi:glycosyltransferase involved in cell wall biosynthesis